LNEKFLKIYDVGEMAAVIPLENEPRDMAAGIIKKPPDLIRIKCIISKKHLFYQSSVKFFFRCKVKHPA